MTAADELPIGDDELPDLFRPLEGRRLALAVSGGVDSMVLMHLVARWLAGSAGGREGAVHLAGPASPQAMDDPTAERPIGLPARMPSGLGHPDWIAGDPSAMVARLPPVVVLTVDHGLRPESAREADMVAAAARRLGLRHQTLMWHHHASEPATFGTPPATGIQEKARAARYGLIADCIEAETWALLDAGVPGISPLSAGRAKRAIVTAHHRDDLVETFLMRLKRGSGLEGLASIRAVDRLLRRPVPERPYPAEVDLVRPLLDVPKSRLVATAARLGIAWSEDPSNTSRQFERVRQRADMDAMAALGFEAPALHLTIRRLQRASELLETRISRETGGSLDASPQLELHDGLFASIALPTSEASAGAPTSVPMEAEAETVLRRLRYAIAAFGGGEEPLALNQLEEAVRHLLHAARLHAVRHQPGTEAAHLPRAAAARTLAGCRIDYWRAKECPEGRIRVWRETGRQPLPQLQLEPGDGAWWDDRFAVSVSREAPAAVIVKALGGQAWAELKRRVPALALWRGIPSGAPTTLPSIWGRDRLLAVPFFESLPRALPLPLRHAIDRDWQAGNAPAAGFYRVRFAPAVKIR